MHELVMRGHSLAHYTGSAGLFFKDKRFYNQFCNVQDRESYWKMMHKYIGSDITSMVTLPVIIFEPMTMLQKMAEVCLVV